MCCRYTLTDQQVLQALAAQLGIGVDIDLSTLPARYNAAPRDVMPVVIHEAGPKLRLLRFGLDAPTGGRTAPLVNARAETLLDRPSFREAARHRRCLVPADGFYEWEKQGRSRLPHYFTLADRRPFFLAGLWQPAATDVTAGSFCVVTTTANAMLAPLHGRMPVLLGPNSGPAWLGDTPLPPPQLARLCRPLPAAMLAGRRATSRVNNARYKAADCLAPP
jgi:putative SOS response-associated peptidase YedK